MHCTCVFPPIFESPFSSLRIALWEHRTSIFNIQPWIDPIYRPGMVPTLKAFNPTNYNNLVNMFSQLSGHQTQTKPDSFRTDLAWEVLLLFLRKKTHDGKSTSKLLKGISQPWPTLKQDKTEKKKHGNQINAMIIESYATKTQPF